METNSTTIGQDYVGAMRFTIAVVLVYGIGVIGLLGISARRNRRKEQADKEVHKFIKLKLTQYAERRQARRRANRTILKLISSLHPSTSNNESEPSSVSQPWLMTRSLPRTYGPGQAVPLRLVGRCNTWSEYTRGYLHMDKASFTSQSKTFHPDKDSQLNLDSASDQSSDVHSSPATSEKSKMNKMNRHCCGSLDQSTATAVRYYDENHTNAFKSDTEGHLDRSYDLVKDRGKHLDFVQNPHTDQVLPNRGHRLHSFRHTHV